MIIFSRSMSFVIRELPITINNVLNDIVKRYFFNDVIDELIFKTQHLKHDVDRYYYSDLDLRGFNDDVFRFCENRHCAFTYLISVTSKLKLNTQTTGTFMWMCCVCGHYHTEIVTKHLHYHSQKKKYLEEGPKKLYSFCKV